MSTVYWIYKDGHQAGPFTFSKIQSMRNAGTIGVTDQIRRMDEQQWRAVGKISHPPRLGRNELLYNTVAVIMLVLLCLAFAGSFLLVWWLYTQHSISNYVVGLWAGRSG